LLKLSLKCGLLTLRQLFKYKYFDDLEIEKFPLLQEKYSFHKCNFRWFIGNDVENLTLYSTNVQIFKIIKILTAIWGDINMVRKNLDKIKVHKSFEITEDESNATLKTLVLFDRLISYEGETFFYEKIKDTFDNISNIRYPSGKIFDISYTIIFPGKYNKPYTEDEEYFGTFKVESDSNKRIKLPDLCEKLIEVCDFAEKNGILDKISKVKNNSMEAESKENEQ